MSTATTATTATSTTESEPVATRYAYRDALLERMPRDERLLCLDTDTGLFRGADFGDAASRYLNLGIAEHTLMAVGAGMAAAGRVPYVNTFAAFAGSRATEAVKIDISYNNLPVRIVGTHGGVAAGHLGPTHHALEDLGVMRMLPNMTVLVPPDERAVRVLMDQLEHVPGPAYLRLGRKATAPLPAWVPDPVLGRLQVLGEGGDVVLVATGSLPVAATLAAADVLSAQGVSATVLHAHTLKPFDSAELIARAAPARLVVTVEEHWPTGGLGTVVAETLAGASPRRVLRIAMPDAFVSRVGTQDELLDAAGIRADAIADRTLEALSDATARATP